MKIKNKYNAPIGFGHVCVAPDEEKEIPAAYDEKHGVLAYYIKRGWIEVLYGNGTTAPIAPVPVAPPNGDVGGDENPPKPSESPGGTPGVSHMSLDELKVYTGQLVLEVGANDTRKVLIDKINAATKEKEGV